MNRTLLRRVVAAFGATFAMLGFAAVPVLAQNNQQSGNGFRISPVRVEYTIEKGKSEVVNLTLENPADVAVTARGVVNDFVASDKEDGEPRLILDETAEAPKNSFRTLAQPIGEVLLAPREKKEINVTLRVPEDANAGGYYGAIRFIPVVGAADSGNVGLTASVGTIVLVRVPGNLTERLDLLQLSAAQNSNAKSFITSGDVQVLTRLKNEGDIHLKPFGKVTVKNMFGTTVKEFEFNSVGDQPDNRANILPGSTRKFEDTVGKVKMPGRYTIEANLGYSQGSGDLISAKATFWYMPVWAILIVVVLIAVLAFGVYLLIRKFTGGTRKSKK